jgi:hypothetical protein
LFTDPTMDALRAEVDREMEAGRAGLAKIKDKDEGTGKGEPQASDQGESGSEDADGSAREA